MAQSMHDYVVESLKGTDVETIANETGISRWTLQKIRLRQIKNPGVKGIEKLYQHFKLREIKKRRAA
jgi:DNA-binding phage protein